MPPLGGKPSTSVGQVFALVAGFLALAVIGAVIGWTLTDTSGISPLASTSQSAAPTPSRTATPSPSASATHAGQVIPDYAALGTSFMVARTQLAALGIQGVPVFDGGTGGNTVVRTSPAAGKPLVKGESIKLYVNEAAPQLNVPDETGVACKTAGSKVAGVGFRTAYATGKTGVVISQNPESTSETAHWNDTVTLTCGPATIAPPSTTPSSPPASAAPSGDPST
jgi:hypothetical protein